MKLKLINILAILLTIIIVGGILYPWSKNNVEHFADGDTGTGTGIDTGTGTGIDTGTGTGIDTGTGTYNTTFVGDTPAADTPDATLSGYTPVATIPVDTPTAITPADTPAADNSRPPVDTKDMENRIKTVYQNLVSTKLYANDLENRVNALKEQIDKKGTVSKDDYLKLINDVQTELQKKMTDNESLGYEIYDELQKDKMAELNNSISILSNKIKNLGFDISGNEQTDSPPANSNIGSIRSVHNGIILNVKNLSLNSLGENTYNSIKPKLSPRHPTIMIFLNNGCLKYNNEDGTYTANNCELTNNKQYFVFKRIDNGTKLLQHLDGAYREQQININLTDNSSQYPFNIIFPISNFKKCLKIDIDGISIEDCRPLSLNLDQRWISSPKTNPICS